MIINQNNIGSVRRALFIRRSWKWNAWVRDFTAWLEGFRPFKYFIEF